MMQLRTNPDKKKGLADKPANPVMSRYVDYLKWLPAPMKNNIGIESKKLIRDANRAVRPHCAISGGAGVPWAAAATAAMTFF